MTPTPSPERPSLYEAARALLAVFERCGPSKPVLSPAR